MKVAVFDSRPYDRASLEEANARYGHELVFFDARLTPDTAPLAQGFPAACAFVNDRLDADVLRQLHAGGVRLVALRCAGFNHVDLAEAGRLGLTVVRVPEYSPHAVAEHAVALILALNRKVHRAYNRVREMNFSLAGLEGFDLYGKTVGVVGTGKIGRAFARIMLGFDCRVLAFDPMPSAELDGVAYVDRPTLYRESDVVSLHAPLTPQTHHLIDAEALAQMKPGVVLINTSRGGLIDTKALVQALKRGKIGAAGLDVYEEEQGVFFRDLSGEVLRDDTLARLMTFPNVLITSHQAFLTREALANIADTTLTSVTAFARGDPLPCRVTG